MKCGRLIKKKIDKVFDFSKESYYENQEGDIQTGFEIISGLPIEEQITKDFHFSMCPSTIGMSDGDNGGEDCHDDCGMCWLDAMNKLYRYTNGEWEVCKKEEAPDA